MKSRLFFCFVIVLNLVGPVLIQCPARPSGVDITASELAEHLGVFAWRIPAKALPDRFTAYLDVIKNGKHLPAESTFTFDRGGDFVVATHANEKGEILVTMSSGVQTISPRISLRTEDCTAKTPLPSQAGLGTYVLCGTYKTMPSGVMVANENLEDLVSGLVLHVEK